MPKVVENIWRIIRRLFRFTFFFCIAIFILANLFILLSGRTYLYKGVISTYLVGETGPTIYDLEKFSYKIIENQSPINWVEATTFNKQEIPSNFASYNEKEQTKAFLVFQGDSILFEKYYDAHEQATVSNSFSAAKTVVSLLIGIAIEEGYIQSLDEPMASYLHEFKGSNAGNVSIRNLLNMASGLNWTESGKNPLSNNAESYYGSDLRELVGRQKLITEPGKIFNYQSGNSQLLGFILEEATGNSVSEYCEKKLWSKMNMSADAYWSLDKEDGDEKAFCCLYATARDFGKIGKLINQCGVWKNEQLVPSWYVEEMLHYPKKITTKQGIENYQYALHAWLYDGYRSPVIYCRGIKGQYVICIPEEDAVIVRLGAHRKENFEMPKEKNSTTELKRVGHPKDLPDYINFAKEIIEQSK